MNKPTFTIKLNGKPIFVGDIRDMPISSFVAAQKEADKNRDDLKLKAEAYLDELHALEAKVAALEAEIKYLKGE